MDWLRYNGHFLQRSYCRFASRRSQSSFSRGPGGLFAGHSPTLDKLSDIVSSVKDNHNPQTVPARLFPYLAHYLGIELDADVDTEEEIRRLLENTVDLHRRKGTVLGFTQYLQSLKLNVNVIPLWTEDYDTFEEEAPEDSQLVENGGTWYITPHISLTVGFGGGIISEEVAETVIERIKRFAPITNVVSESLSRTIFAIDDFDLEEDTITKHGRISVYDPDPDDFPEGVKPRIPQPNFLRDGSMGSRGESPEETKIRAEGEYDIAYVVVRNLVDGTSEEFVV